MNSHAVDDGLNAFLRAITIMRKNPRVLNPVYRVLSTTSLIAGGIFLCTMFFGRDLDAMTIAIALLGVAFVFVTTSIVIEFVTTIAMTANVRLSFPRLPGDVRDLAKRRIVESFQADALGTLGFFGGIIVSMSSVFFSYVFASIALSADRADPSAMWIMFSGQMVSVMLSALATLYTVMTGRYIVVHNLSAREAFANARARIAQYASSCMVIVVINIVMGFAQAMLAFLALANHTLTSLPLVDAVGLFASVSMFAVMWIVQIVPYIALTERRSVERF